MRTLKNPNSMKHRKLGFEFKTSVQAVNKIIEQKYLAA